MIIVIISPQIHAGYAAVAEIMAILKDIPLGEQKLEIGLQLRQAMFLNSILFNSESWHNVSDDDLKSNY